MMQDASIRQRMYEAALDELLPRLPRRHGLAMLYLLRYSNANLECVTTVAQMAKRLNLNDETAGDCLNDLYAWNAVEYCYGGYKITGRLLDENGAVDWFAGV